MLKPPRKPEFAGHLARLLVLLTCTTSLIQAAESVPGVPAAARNAESPILVDPDGTVHIPTFAMPLSIYMSEEGRRIYRDFIANPIKIDSSSIEKLRASMDELFFAPRMAKAQEKYPVKIGQTTIAGVPAAVVIPRDGIAARNKRRVLINLHGGGFYLGAGLGGLIESIPIASEGKIKVITIDYREGPEHKFPAASEDVAAVYRELLKIYAPESIGIYGCSAGGMLTAMAVAWFQKERLPPPGAIGIFCSPAGAVFGGDSAYYTPPLDWYARSAPPPAQPNPPPMPMDYLGNVDLADPLVSPVMSDAVLAKFPPTLLMAGGRGSEVSSVTYTHNRLTAVNVPAELHLWDGLWHGFLYEVTLPEARQAYRVAAKFFDQNLK